MKHIQALLLAMVLSPLSCYINNTDNSRTSLMIGSPVPATVKAIHVAVYENTTEEQNLLQVETVNPESVVTLYVTNGSARIFVIWAESFSGTANYYGKSSPVDIGQGTNPMVTMSMKKFNVNADVFNRTLVGSVHNWNAVAGASAYELQIYNSSYQYVTAYFGPATTVTVPSIYGGQHVRAHSDVFDLNSDWSN